MSNTHYHTSWADGARIRRLDNQRGAPDRFTTVITGEGLPFVAEMECAVTVTGEVHALSLCLHAPDGKHLDSEVRNHLAIRRWTSEALACVSWPMAAEEPITSAIPRLRTLRGRSGRQRINNRDRLAEVAATWKAANDAGQPPVKAVRALGWSPAQAQRLVNAAREAGLLD